MKTRIIGAAALAVAALGLTACATTSGSADTSTKPVATQPAASESAKAAAPTTIGSPFTYKDGLSVIVMDAVPATLHPEFDPKPGVIVTVQVQNKTAKALEQYVEVDVTSGPAGQTAQSDYDNSALGFQASIPPGGTATARYAFTGVVDPNVLTVAVRPTWDYEPAFFRKG